MEESQTRNIRKGVTKTTSKRRKNTVLFGHVKCGTYRHIARIEEGARRIMGGDVISRTEPRGAVKVGELLTSAKLKNSHSEAIGRSSLPGACSQARILFTGTPL